MDRGIELVAGASSSGAERCSVAGRFYGIDATRAYADYEAMFEVERSRGDGIDFVAIVSPNHTHLHAATSALRAGIAVFSDKQ